MDETAKPKKRGRRTRPAVEEAISEARGVTISPKKKKISIEDVSTEELFKRECNVLKLEWAFYNKGATPLTWLQEQKKKHIDAAHGIIDRSGGAAAWYAEKEGLRNSVVETLVKRQVDQIVEVQDQHISGSKLLFAKAIEMLTLGPKAKDGTHLQLRSIDLVNCAVTLEKVQKIYRTIMGLGMSEEQGFSQLVEAIQKTGVQVNIQNNTTIHEAKTPDLSPEEDAYRESVKRMTYEDMTEIIEWRREQKQKRLEEQKAMAAQKKGEEKKDG